VWGEARRDERRKSSARGSETLTFLSGAERASNPVRFYEFDRFRIDTKRRLLMREGGPIAIKAKALDTLVLLVQNAGRLLEKAELMNRLWPDTAVEEANSLRTSSRCGKLWARCRASSGSSRRSPGRLSLRRGGPRDWGRGLSAR